MANPEKIVQLADQIRSNTLIVQQYLTQNGLPTPDLTENGPLSSVIPANATEIVIAREAVIADALELNKLMRGPTEHLMALAATTPHDCLSLQAVYRLRLFERFVPGSETTFESLSKATNVNVADLRRLMRHAMTNGIFEERDEGKVVHTAASRLLHENQIIRDIIGIMTEEMYPSSAKTLEALQRFNGSHAPNQSGFSLANTPSRSIYEELQVQHSRGLRFAGAMKGFASRTNVDAIAAAHDWSACKIIVDVGGGWGPVSAALAEKFQGPFFVVQDLPHVVIEGMNHVPDAVKERLSFEPGDAFKTQNRKGADVYLLRHVLHNYPDESCSMILRAQAMALDKSSCIIIYDTVRPEKETKLLVHQEKMKRSMDLTMLTFFGSRERTLKEWKDIIRNADERLELLFRDGYPNAEDNVLKVIRRDLQ